MSLAYVICLKLDLEPDSEYPVFVTDKDIHIKVKPRKEDEKIRAVVVVKTVKPVKEIEEFTKEDAYRFIDEIGDIDVDKEVLKTAIEAVFDVAKNSSKHMGVFDAELEIYRGDYEKFLGEVKASLLAIRTRTQRYYISENQAWAIAFSMRDRIQAKYSLLKTTRIEAKVRLGRPGVLIVIPLRYRALDETLAETENDEELKRLKEEINMLEEKLRELKKKYEDLLRKRVFIENIDKKREELLKKLVDNYT